MDELKPCPFCGGEAAMQAPNMHRKVCVFCKECGVSTGWGAVDTITSAWNRRSRPANEPKECPSMVRVEGGIPYCSDRQTACDGCKPATEPLTLEQLREMDGEPVYIKYHTCGRWEIYQSFMHDHGLYGKTWLAYRRKPEGSENDA